jgi:hypothetical protein
MGGKILFFSCLKKEQELILVLTILNFTKSNKRRKKEKDTHKI